MSILPDLNYVRSLPDPAPNWRWVVNMPPLQSGTVAGSGLDISVGRNIGSGPLGLESSYFTMPTVPFGIVEQIDFASQSIDSDARFQAGSRTMYPRFLSVANVSITFYEDVRYATTQYLSYWKSLVVDDDRNYGLPAAYKKDIYLFAFDTISNVDPTFVGLMRGCWPTSISGLSFSNGGSNKVTLVCDFAVDEAKPFASGSSYGSESASSLTGTFTNFAARVNSQSSALRGQRRF